VHLGEAHAREGTREEAQLVGVGSAQAACRGAASSGRPRAREVRKRGLVVWASAQSRGEEARALSRVGRRAAGPARWEPEGSCSRPEALGGRSRVEALLACGARGKLAGKA
jgi:hypothetical protein